ncbi:MAG: hypothetical protein H6996_01740 [Moraxellaceae bacterium]|nr:hypothetical protein [Pseudomonadales bacterium]MCP5173809.1 hypothetical protein [Moraxellaceae bacterium]MCP5176872.1 hypothetical protein [Moraxellaceae bacterium]
MRYQITTLLLASLLSACANSPSSYGTGVLPSHTLMKEGGVYQSSGYGISGDDSEKAATFNANESCGVFKKMPIVSKMDTKYQGTVGEDVNKTVNMVSGIVKSVTGKDYGTTATDKDYKTTVIFRCQ